MEQFVVSRARHAWPERAGFTINRPKGHPEYTFLHFFAPVELLTSVGKIRTLPDSCIVYKPGEAQWFHSESPLCHDWMHIQGDLSGIMEMAGLKTGMVYAPGNAKWITAILREIEMEVLTKPAMHEELTQLKVTELFLKLGRATEKEFLEPLSSDAVKRLLQVRKRVFAHLEQQWSVADMATLAYLSASRFHALYKQAFGISPTDDLIHARIDTARIRLTDSNTPIGQISQELGYRNQTHFCRQFKQITGLTPGEFRMK